MGYSDPIQKAGRLVARTVNEYNMITSGDRIIVGISGGKDSLLLMHLLHRLQRKAPFKFELIGATFEPGFSEMDVDGIRRYCAAQGWTHRVIGMDIPSLLKEKGITRGHCSLCSRMRRGKLHALADREGSRIIALGHHLQDLAVSLLMGIFRGRGLTTLAPVSPADGNKKMLIRPLAKLPEELLLEAVARLDLPIFDGCPHEEELKQSGDRARLERLLHELAGDFPRIEHHMLSAMQRVHAEWLLDPRFAVTREQIEENFSHSSEAQEEQHPSEQESSC